ncbi:MULTISPECIES: PDZ domain-containing protein [Sphingobium]|uniref:Protease n=1 Tax=Sphingobium chungbukense TaxID=56193 RepID=A0A0M3AVH9_9SPHN|nr:MULTISPECIES: PDZ domain-containing protein [Sphingobium]KKW93918.1 protease [Sphingobium chungbukense]PJG48358.1 protease [Sphingobium sp. LB126]
MAKRSIDNHATGLLLAGLALCALLMSLAFFLHLRRATDGHLEAAAAKARSLPGVTLMDGMAAGGRPGVIVTSMESDGQAARLGISVGDGVVSLNGTPISSLDQASAYLLHHPQPKIALGLRHADRMRVVMLDRPEGGR